MRRQRCVDEPHRLLYRKRRHLQNGLTVHLLVMAEASHLLLSSLLVCRRLVPIVRSRQKATSWRQAADAGNKVRTLSNYSVLCNLPRIKNVLPGTWMCIRAEIGFMEMSQSPTSPLKVIVALGRVLAFSVAELVAFGCGLLSLNQKLGEVRGVSSGFLGFIGFANQITGIVDQEDIRMQAVLRLVFAGATAEFSREQAHALREFNGMILCYLCRKHGWCRGVALYLSLTAVDYQKLVVADGSAKAYARASSRLSKSLSTNWWLKGASRKMILGQLFVAFEQLGVPLES